MKKICRNSDIVPYFAIFIAIVGTEYPLAVTR